MSSCRDALAAVLLLIGLTGLTTAQAADTYPRIGRPATAAERKAWDTDVRPDFKGLPKGAGSVAQGQVVWEAKCAGCHDVFCESNDVFTALVGPALRAVAQKYAARSDAVDFLAGRIRQGGVGVWGSIPMPAQAIAEDDALAPHRKWPVR